MIRKLFILGLVLAVCLELSQGKPRPQAKTMEDYAEALMQGMCMHAELRLIRKFLESSNMLATCIDKTYFNFMHTNYY